MSKKFRNPDLKYFEQILDLEGDDEFILDIAKLRKELGIPKNGFVGLKDENKFISNHHISLEPKFSKRDILELQKKLKGNQEKVAIAIAWNNLLETQRILLDKYGIPQRAHLLLHFYILFGNKPTTIEEAKFVRSYYGVDIQMHMRFQGNKESIGNLKHDDDIAAIIFVYPEATKRDIREAIEHSWSDIEVVQMDILKRLGKRKIRIKKKTARPLHDKILRLRNKGMTFPEISKRLDIKSEGAFEFTRKVVSRKRKIAKKK